jgi:hypothetical protein
MPRFNITPLALRQAETNPGAFLDAETEALFLALEKLFPSLSTDQIIEMEEKHKELHMVLERYERAYTTYRRACRNRRGPLLTQWREILQQAVEAGAPAHWVSHLRQQEAELGEYYPELE